MTARSALTAAAIAAGITLPAAPAGAGEVRAFEAWGHSFTVTAAQAANRADLSTAPRHAYTSALAVDAAEASAAGARAVRTLNIWGARIEAPAD